MWRWWTKLLNVIRPTSYDFCIFLWNCFKSDRCCELHWNLYMYDIRFATWDFTMNLPCFYPDFTFRSYIQSRVRWLTSSCEAIFFVRLEKRNDSKSTKNIARRPSRISTIIPTWSLTVRPWKVTIPKRTIVFQPSSFRGELLNFRGVDLGKSLRSHLRCFGSSGFGEG